MRILFVFLAAVVSSRTLEDLNDKDLQEKLSKYQIATGIDDAKRNEIWHQTMKNVFGSDSKHSEEKVMARYGISQDLSGLVSPINMDVEYFNEGMMYQSGIFIIMDPGYYRLTIQCYHAQSGANFSKWSAIRVFLNSKETITTFCKWADNGIAYGIFYLEAFDTVYTEKTGELLSGGAFWNNFMIEKV